MPRFKSRVDGLKSRVPHWCCNGCGSVFTKVKPGVCTNCRVSGKYTYFPSRKEYNRYVELTLLERSGHIDAGSLELQPAYKLHVGGRSFKVSFDFRYRIHGKEVIEDVKTSGTNTDLSKIKRAMAETEYGIKVVLV